MITNVFKTFFFKIFRMIESLRKYFRKDKRIKYDEKVIMLTLKELILLESAFKDIFKRKILIQKKDDFIFVLNNFRRYSVKYYNVFQRFKLSNLPPDNINEKYFNVYLRNLILCFRHYLNFAIEKNVQKDLNKKEREYFKYLIQILNEVLQEYKKDEFGKEYIYRRLYRLYELLPYLKIRYEKLKLFLKCLNQNKKYVGFAGTCVGIAGFAILPFLKNSNVNALENISNDNIRIERKIEQNQNALDNGVFIEDGQSKFTIKKQDNKNKIVKNALFDWDAYFKEKIRIGIDYNLNKLLLVQDIVDVSELDSAEVRVYIYESPSIYNLKKYSEQKKTSFVLSNILKISVIYTKVNNPSEFEVEIYEQSKAGVEQMKKENLNQFSSLINELEEFNDKSFEEKLYLLKKLTVSINLTNERQSFTDVEKEIVNLINKGYINTELFTNELITALDNCNNEKEFNDLFYIIIGIGCKFDFYDKNQFWEKSEEIRNSFSNS